MEALLDLVSKPFSVATAIAVIIIYFMTHRYKSLPASQQEHIKGLRQEAIDADSRADKYQAVADAERERRLAAEKRAHKAESLNESLTEKVENLTREIARLNEEMIGVKETLQAVRNGTT